MNNEKKKILIFTSAVVLVLLMIGLAFFFSSRQSLIQIQLEENGYVTEPLQTGVFNFRGVDGTYETTWLGQLISNDEGSTIIIDGDNDGERAISNSLDSGSKLKLSSTNQIISNSQGSTNYIQAKITLPAGKITANYDYLITDYYGDVASVSFTIGDYSKTFKTPWFHTYERGGSISGSDSYEMEFNEQTELIFRVETTTDRKNENAIGNLEIEFTPRPTQIKYYRLADKICGEVLIFPSEKTENDYLTLEECQNNIPEPIPFWFFVLVGFVLVLVVVFIIFINRRLHKR